MIQKSHDDRMLWAQFDALEMGTGWGADGMRRTSKSRRYWSRMCLGTAIRAVSI